MRWGITSEMQERGDTLPTLLSEIDRCRPYFIGLLGDRYGWVPPPEALTHKLKTDYPAIADAHGASVTAMEIIHGVLSNPDTAARAFFFERDPKWGWIATLNEADRMAATAEPDAARVKLAELKTLIRQKARVEAYARPEDIGQKVTEVLDALLEARFPEAQVPDAFEQRARLHSAYARERRGLHVGAEGYLRDLMRWMETKQAPSMLIAGASGGGKSTLVANWLRAWRKDHPNDIVFEHYLGASPDSADPMLLMRRMWEHLNRASGETVDLPDANAELMDVSAGLAQRLAQARATTDGGGAHLLIVFDGLDKLSSEQNLRWLPIVPGVRLLVSSLDGEAKCAALARGFDSLEVMPLMEQQRQEFIAGTLARWRRELEPQHIVRILQPAAAELAGSPLYLKTVLDELRVSADNARLSQRLEDYRGARHMPDLFDRVLKRLEDDCEPGLVAAALPLIWASRAGLEETEIVAMTGATPLGWATLRNGLGEGLRDQAGRLAFSHDYLKEAVATRYLASVDQQRAIHRAIADHFQKREPDVRQAEELPYQLLGAEEWTRLQTVLSDLERIPFVFALGNSELARYWDILRRVGFDPERSLRDLCDRAKTNATFDVDARLNLNRLILSLLMFMGVKSDDTLILAQDTVELARAERHSAPILRNAENTLAELLLSRGEYSKSQQLLERIVAVDETNPDIFGTRANLAKALRALGKYDEAKTILEQVIAQLSREQGEDAPDTIAATNILANTLQDSGAMREALNLRKRVFELSSKKYGPRDVRTLESMGNLATALGATGDWEGERKLEADALELQSRVLGPEHQMTLGTMNNYVNTLHELGRREEAAELGAKALESMERVLGVTHPRTILLAANLCGAYAGMKQWAVMRQVAQRALAATVNIPAFEQISDQSAYGQALDALRLASSVRDVDSAGGWAWQAQAPNEGDFNELIELSDRSVRQFQEGDLASARRGLEQVVDGARRHLGDEHLNTMGAMNNLGEVLRAQEDFGAARELFEKTAELRRRALGEEHPRTLDTLNNLALTYSSLGEAQRAKKLQEEVVAVATRVLGGEDPVTINFLYNLMTVLAAAGEWEAAETLTKQIIEKRMRALGEAHPLTQACVRDLDLIRQSMRTLGSRNQRLIEKPD